MTEILLQASDVRKSYSHPINLEILRGVELTVSAKSSVAICGRSGEGKSTLLHLLGGLDKPSQGQIAIKGQMLSSGNRALLCSREIGFVFQSFHLLEDFTSLENVLMPAKIARKATKRGSPAYDRALELLSWVGLSDRAHFSVKTLSGGERQRVAIARALCNDPSLLLADEPTGNLDSKTARGICDLLLQFAEKEGKALVLITHDSGFAARCTARYQLEEGRLKAE